jgi:1-acyl-sn-glycerol-3-phosphate acyltransferase
MMRTVAVWLYQIYAWLIFFPLVILLTLIASALTILCATLISPKWASAIVPPAWGRVLTYLTPVRVIVEGGEHANRGQSYVVTINHQSMYDIIIVYGWLKLDLKWVIKKELRKMPGIGLGCEKAGHIFVDRRKPKQAAKAIRDALSRLGDGVGVLFFPEGTRSLDGRLLPFKSGAFRLAKEQGLPVLPVTLVGTRGVLPAQSLRVFPGSVRMVIHPPISPQGKAVDELVEETRQAIASALPAELR